MIIKQKKAILGKRWDAVLIIIWYIIVVSNIIPFYYKVMRSRVLYENIIWMKVVLRNLSKSMKKNKLLNYNNYQNQRHYHNSGYKLSQNQVFNKKYDGFSKIEKSIGSKVPEDWTKKEIEDLKESFIKTIKHPTFIEKGNEIGENNIEIKIGNVTTKNKQIISRKDYIDVKSTGIIRNGKEQYVVLEVKKIEVKKKNF